jgi:hypothetical protein
MVNPIRKIPLQSCSLVIGKEKALWLNSDIRPLKFCIGIKKICNKSKTNIISVAIFVWNQKILELFYTPYYFEVPLFINNPRSVKGIDTIAVMMYKVLREFWSMWYPKKGRKGIGNKNTIHSPTIRRINLHRFLIVHVIKHDLGSVSLFW